MGAEFAEERSQSHERQYPFDSSQSSESTRDFWAPLVYESAREVVGHLAGASGQSLVIDGCSDRVEPGNHSTHMGRIAVPVVQ